MRNGVKTEEQEVVVVLMMKRFLSQLRSDQATYSSLSSIYVNRDYLA